MRTQRLIVCAFAACLVSLLAGSAMATDHPRNPAVLKGTYRHIASGSGASVPTQSSSELGFNPWPDLTARGGGSAGDHTYFTGVITYDGMGHATETIQGIIIFTGGFGPGSLPPLLTFEENCDWTYVVNRDFSFSREGTCVGTTTGGRFAGSPYTLSGLKWVGQIGAGGLVLISYRVDPTMETTLSNGFFTKGIGAAQGTEVRMRKQ